MANDKPSALDCVNGLLALMPDWQLGETTQRMLRENDNWTAGWAEMTSTKHPGANVSISSSRERGKWHISADYPKDFQPWVDGRGRVYSESINASKTKTAQQIAKDIQRRLFDDTGYLQRAAVCFGQMVESTKAQTAGEDLARDLALRCGAQTESDRAGKYNHLRTDENARKFTHWPGTSGPRINVKVAHGGNRVDFEVHDINPAEARELVGWFNRVLVRRKAAGDENGN